MFCLSANPIPGQYYGYEDKYGNKGALTKAQIMASTLQKYAYRAIEYAPKEISDKYSAEIQESVTFVKSVTSGSHDKTVNKKKGCYIATAVYGSYVCEEVFTLRGFRDDHLSKYVWGRWAIRIYYAVSPCLAKRIKPKSRFGKLTRSVLNKIVDKIHMEAQR